ncbi:MAG TPA: hypothetical protein VFK92_17675 [Burkholderiales bacterium]|nr:hypothetical protein [Burkholderiales bacterium]
MAIDVRLIQPKDFIKTAANGELDLAVSKELMRKTAEEMKSTPIRRILLDSRQAVAKWSPATLYEVAVVFTEDPAFRNTRVAILTRHERIDNARFLTLVANSRGAQMMAFEDFEDAIDWLVLSGPP